MAQEVIALKLSSGEEIIARVENRDDEAITLDRPMMVVLTPSPDGQGIGIQMMPWLASNQDATARVFNSHVIATVAPNGELEKGYLQQTSRIQL